MCDYCSQLQQQIKFMISKYCSIFLLFLLAGSATAVECPVNCSTCSTSILCSACSAGYALVNLDSACIQCPAKCTTCTFSTAGVATCTACQSSFTLLNGACLICDPSCLTCSNTPKNCATCASDLELVTVNGTGRCQIPVSCPIQNCATCATQTGTGYVYCQTCKTGFFNFLNGCQTCKKPCRVCTLDQNTVWNTVKGSFRTSLASALNVDLTVIPVPNAPAYLNGWDFEGMTRQFKGGWLFAYYLYGSVINYIDASSRNQLIRIVASFFITIQNKTYQEKIAATLKWIGKNIFRYYTLDDLIQMAAKQASKTATCSGCLSQYYYNAGSCNPCTDRYPGCLECTYVGGPPGISCSSCRDGYHDPVNSCTACDSACKTCSGSSSSSCTSCYAPLILVNGQCKTCYYPCKTCTSASTCLTCLPPFSSVVNTAGQCFRCSQDSCLRCAIDDTQICLECKDQKFLNQGVCSDCPSNCDSCVGSVCITCHSGFTLVDSKCTPCDGNGCQNCLKQHPQICYQCKKQMGFYLDTLTGACTRCQDYCLACTGPNTCTKWQEGIVAKIGALEKCAPGCSMCLTTDTCYLCKKRHYKNTNNLCTPCPNGCNKCTSSGCQSCIRGYVLKSNSMCMRCNSSCKACDPTDANKCTQCFDNYVLSTNDCVSACTPETGCLVCNPTNSSQCQFCQKGYALRLTDLSCIKCLGDCAVCDSTYLQSCFQCKPGYKMVNKKCEICPFGCRTCSQLQCTQCIDTHELTQDITGQIVCKQKCLFPCQKCSNGVCTKCVSGYAQIGTSQCQLDISCTPNCPFCPAGTYLNAPDCIQCAVKKCASCTSTTCFSCLQGYYLQSAKCHICGPSCKTCLSYGDCLTCAAGYLKQIDTPMIELSNALYLDECIKCSDNCKTCDIKAEMCTSCNEGEVLYGTFCASPFNLKFTYEISTSLTEFFVDGHLSNFIQDLATELGISSRDIIISQIKSGSTILSGLAIAISQAVAISLQTSFPTSLSRFTVVSSSSSVVNSSPSQNNNNNNQETVTDEPKLMSASNTGIVVGIIVGISVVAIFVVYAVYMFVCNSKSVEAKIVDKDQTSQIVINEDVKYVSPVKVVKSKK